MGLISRLKHFFSPTRWITEEEDLASDLDRLEKEDPDWDLQSRLATVQYLLDNGHSRSFLVETYGERIVSMLDEKKMTG